MRWLVVAALAIGCGDEATLAPDAAPLEVDAPSLRCTIDFVPGMRCSGTCVDIAEDRENCGECGVACDDGLACVHGECTAQCPSSRTLCSNACVDTTRDPDSCGSCGHACGDTQVCSAGRCVCPYGTTLCDGTCVESSSLRNLCNSP